MSIELVTKLYASMPAAVEKGRKKFGRPVTLTEKILLAHADNLDAQVWERGRAMLALRPDRVAMQNFFCQVKPVPELSPADLPRLPKTVEQSMKDGEVLVTPLITTTISDDRGEEPLYEGYPASELINKGYGIPHIIGLLWDKRLISKQDAEIIKRILMLSADHGQTSSLLPGKSAERDEVWPCRRKGRVERGRVRPCQV